jgi:hypothetical protein
MVQYTENNYILRPVKGKEDRNSWILEQKMVFGENYLIGTVTSSSQRQPVHGSLREGVKRTKTLAHSPPSL